jgi:hypothetical protein
MREYLARCRFGHRCYLRLTILRWPTLGRCSTCGQPAELYPLPPPRAAA